MARLQAVETIREFLTGAAMSLILDLPFLVIALAVMFVYSWQLSLIAVGKRNAARRLSLLVTPLTRPDQSPVHSGRSESGFRYRIHLERRNGQGAAGTLLERRYGDYLEATLSSAFATRNLSNSYNIAAGALEQAMTVTILVAGALLVMRGDGFTIGMLVAFQMFAARMAQPMPSDCRPLASSSNKKIAVRRSATS